MSDKSNEVERVASLIIAEALEELSRTHGITTEQAGELLRRYEVAACEEVRQSDRGGVHLVEAIVRAVEDALESEAHGRFGDPLGRIVA